MIYETTIALNVQIMDAKYLQLDLLDNDEFDVFRLHPERILKSCIENRVHNVLVTATEVDLNRIKFYECFEMGIRFDKVFAKIGRIAIVLNNNGFRDGHDHRQGVNLGSIRLFNDEDAAKDWLFNHGI